MRKGTQDVGQALESLENEMNYIDRSYKINAMSFTDTDIKGPISSKAILGQSIMEMPTVTRLTDIAVIVKYLKW